MSVIQHFNTLYDSYLRRLQQEIEVHEYDDITVANYPYILAIYEETSITVSSLAERMGVKKASVSQMLDRLVKTGYVERVRQETDKRSIQVRLTPRGREFVDTETGVYMRFIDHISQALSPEEWQTFERLLGQLAEAADHES
ncbi:hypothetical protein A6395_04290 [Exiguobacterium sp. SH31]|uniref:MarR family winged helix-turn-helix transcriptional regulator n=1 Tax=Exiguobacterium sp. SH31 TaxID=1843183 RepID=UPI0008ADB2F2|nr:MarR family transcriptional regulator [Exiguobacterium sp. SH31]OGX79827.1 hypothetical protein A6395_04290 [Exiguobacterium sp. SH31]